MRPADRVYLFCPSGRASFRHLVRSLSQMRSFGRVPSMCFKLKRPPLCVVLEGPPARILPGGPPLCVLSGGSLLCIWPEGPPLFVVPGGPPSPFLSRWPPLCLAGTAFLKRPFGRASFMHLARRTSFMCLVWKVLLKRHF